MSPLIILGIIQYMNYTLDENKNLINILDAVYSIGSIYMSVNSTGPSAYLRVLGRN